MSHPNSLKCDTFGFWPYRRLTGRMRIVLLFLRTFLRCIIIFFCYTHRLLTCYNLVSENLALVYKLWVFEERRLLQPCFQQEGTVEAQEIVHSPWCCNCNACWSYQQESCKALKGCQVRLSRLDQALPQCGHPCDFKAIEGRTGQGTEKYWWVGSSWAPWQCEVSISSSHSIVLINWEGISGSQHVTLCTLLCASC